MTTVTSEVRINLLIAEHVMDYKPCDDPVGRCDAARMDPPRCWGPVVNGQIHGSDLRDYCNPTWFPQDVWDRMVRWSHERNWEPAIHAEKSGRYQVSFMFGCGRRADTLTMAIALAALEAHGLHELEP